MSNPTIMAHVLVYLVLFSFTECNVPTKQTDKDAAPSLASEDATFAAKAASDGIMKVELGDVAQKSENDEVKKIGSMMVADQTKTDSALKSLASGKNLVLPDSMSTEDQQKVNELLKKTGDEFDRAYIDMMVDGHIGDIDLFKKEGQQGKDADMRSFASGTLPVLEKHLDAARTAQKIVAGM